MVSRSTGNAVPVQRGTAQPLGLMVLPRPSDGGWDPGMFIQQSRVPLLSTSSTALLHWEMRGGLGQP